MPILSLFCEKCQEYKELLLWHSEEVPLCAVCGEQYKVVPPNRLMFRRTKFETQEYDTPGYRRYLQWYESAKRSGKYEPIPEKEAKRQAEMAMEEAPSSASDVRYVNERKALECFDRSYKEAVEIVDGCKGDTRKIHDVLVSKGVRKNA